MEITRQITKHNYLVMNVEEIPRIIREAFFLAASGRPGPVLVDIPKDVQQQMSRVLETESEFERVFISIADSAEFTANPTRHRYDQECKEAGDLFRWRLFGCGRGVDAVCKNGGYSDLLDVDGFRCVPRK